MNKDLPELQSYCHYCNHPLDRKYYFCRHCSTPYTYENNVLTPLRPIKLTTGQLVDKKAPLVKTIFWTYFSVIIGTGVLCLIVFEEKREDLVNLIVSAAIFITTCCFTIVYWQSLKKQLSHLGLCKEVFISCVLLPPLLLLNYAYHMILLPLVSGDDLQFIDYHEFGYSPSLLLLLFCILPAITEEIAFRGLLQHQLQTALTNRKALILSSALFAAMHFSVISLPYLFLVGYLLGWTKLKSNSLYPGIFLHFLHNFIVIIYF